MNLPRTIRYVSLALSMVILSRTITLSQNSWSYLCSSGWPSATGSSCYDDDYASLGTPGGVYVEITAGFCRVSQATKYAGSGLAAPNGCASSVAHMSSTGMQNPFDSCTVSARTCLILLRHCHATAVDRPPRCQRALSRRRALLARSSVRDATRSLGRRARADPPPPWRSRQQFGPVHASSLAPTLPLEPVQIDHTPAEAENGDHVRRVVRPQFEDRIRDVRSAARFERRSPPTQTASARGLG
jgi:hypothetical protein